MNQQGLDVIPGATREECWLLCNDANNCNFFSYFGEKSYPVHNTCVLYYQWCEVVDCEGCVTEDASCWKSDSQCLGSVEGGIGNNLVKFIQSTSDSMDCKSRCANEANCSYYTYYSNTSPLFPGGCFLLSRLEAPLQECSHCRTGARSCDQTNTCFLEVDGEITDSSVQLTNTTYSSVKAVALGVCELTAVAIGGGGHGDKAGGGSGYVSWKDLRVAGIRSFGVQVGAAGGESLVAEDGDVLIQGAPGESTIFNQYSGGAGYSGGGEGNGNPGSGGEGGTDGGDGLKGGIPSAHGGTGSGLKVASIPIHGFMLT